MGFIGADLMNVIVLLDIYAMFSVAYHGDAR